MNTDLVKERLSGIRVEQLMGMPHAMVEVKAGDLVYIPAGVATLEWAGPEMAVGVRSSCYIQDESSVADLKVALSMFEASASPFAAKLQQIITLVEAGARAMQEQVATAAQQAALAEPLQREEDHWEVSTRRSVNFRKGVLEPC